MAPDVQLIKSRKILRWEGVVKRRNNLYIIQTIYTIRLPGGSDDKEFTCNVGDLGSIPGLGRSPGKGNGYPLQHSCLENSMGRGAWQTTVHSLGSQRIRHSWATFTFICSITGMNEAHPKLAVKQLDLYNLKL